MHGRLALALALAVSVLFSTRPAPTVAQTTAVDIQPYAPPLALGPVTSVLQDRTGVLWIGTHSGLVRFDGFEAVEYRPVADDSTTLRNGLVRALWEGLDGILWVGTAAGLHQFDTRTGTATWLGPTDPSAYGTTGDQFIQTIWVDPDQRVWSGAIDWTDQARGGLHALDPEDGSTRHYHHDPDDPASLSHDWVRAVHRDAAGALWVGTWHGLNRLDPATGGFDRFYHDPEDPSSLAYDDVSALLTDRAGRLWVGTIGGGLDLLDPATGAFRHHRHDPADAATLSSDHVTALAEDAEGRIWVATQDGLNRLDPSTGEVMRFLPTRGEARLSGAEVVHVAAGREGGLWIGGYLSRHTGFVDYADLAGGSRGALTDLTPDAADLPVTDVSAAAGEIWVSTWGRGAMRVDPVTGERTPFPPSVADQIPDSLWSVAAADGRVFLVTWDNDVVMVDLATQVVQRVGPPPASPGGRPPRAYGGGLAVDGATTWAAFNSGVLMGFTRGDTAVTFGLVVPRDFNDHVVDGGGWHWVATGTGIWRFRPGEAPADVWSLAGVSSLLVDAAGGGWAGTFEQGLFRLTPGVQEPVRFTGEGDGLPRSLSVSALLEDVRGRIWVADHRRLWEIDPGSGMVAQHDPSSFIARGAAIGVGVAARLGEALYIGGTGGLLAIHPERLKANPHPPSVSLVGVSVDNLRRALPPDGTPLDLRHDENSLTFDYVGLHFTHPARNRYRVRLSGAEVDWREVGTARSVTYPGLPGGTFAFEVMAANADGVWSEPAVLARVRVLPPWWRTPWAYAGGLALMLGVLWSVRRFELDRLELRARAEMESSEAERLRSLDRMKSEFFEDMSHEFRTPLAIIQGQLGRLLEDSGDDERPQLRMAIRNARRMQQMTDRILDLARIESGSLELEAAGGDLVPFLRALVAAFDSLAASRDIHLSFRSDRDRVLLRFDPDRLEMAIANLISNALKFTREGGAVAVTLRTIGTAGDRDGRIEIEVADTGIGIPARDIERIFERFRRVEGRRSGEPGTGIGLALARSLVVLHGGTLRVSSQEGVGSRFVASFPYPLVEDAPLSAGRNAGPSSPPAAADSDPAAGEDRREAQVASTGSDGELLLIIEDNPDMRAFLRQELEGSYDILEASDGEAGLARAFETIPDLILTDVMMPGVDGHAVARRLREDSRTSHIPIVMLTARASTENRIEGLESGVDEYLPKPFSSRLLQTRIRNLLDLRRLLRERYATETWIRPSDVEATDVDRAFLERLVEVVEERLSDPEFSVPDLASAVHLSTSQLTRKLKALVDQTPGSLIRGMRLHRAADLLRQHAGSVAEIAYRTGFADQAHFSRSFKAMYGQSPSKYRG